MAESKSRDEIQKDVRKNKTIWVGEVTPPFTEHFRVSKQLGEPGQFGVTYRCIRKKDKNVFAVKLLNKNRFYRIPIKYRNRFLRAMHDEIEILQTLRDHPNIIQLESVYEDKPTLYIVMEECTGGELFARIVQRGQYTETDAAFVIKQLMSALKWMHKVNDIVHCDLKPDNILFADKREKSPVKIIDFGMSKVLPRLQYLTHLCGTPYYTAPEIIKDKKFNHQCDTWSIGVILYVMIFGYPPFYVDPQTYGKRERRAIYQKIAGGFRHEIRETDKYGFGPWYPSHIPVSDAVRDFMSNLLEIDVEKRYTASEALGHPWLVNMGRTDSKSPDSQKKYSTEMITALAKFSNTCQFKLVIAKLFRDQFIEMRPHHFKKLEEMFQEMDTDGDGIVSFEEFERAIGSIPDIPLKTKHIKEMFNELNVEEVKGIRFEDLLNAVVHDYLVACDERLYAAFRELDEDEDGLITTEQLKAKLKVMDPCGEWDRALQVIEEQALDRGGKIDYSEFLVSLHPNFEEAPVWIADLQQMKSMKVHKGRKRHHKGSKRNGKKHRSSKKDKDRAGRKGSPDP